MVLRIVGACAALLLGLPAQGQAPATPESERPMATGMMKPGMMQGDVKKAAEENETRMQHVLETEEASMAAKRAQASAGTRKERSRPPPGAKPKTTAEATPEPIPKANP